MTKRSLHHYPHDALAQKLGVAAFAMGLVLVATLAISYFLHGVEIPDDWIAAAVILTIIISNLFGVFSQVLSGGRCWIGAVALASVWICVFITIWIADF